MKKKVLTTKQWKDVFDEIDREVIQPSSSYQDACNRLMEFGKIKCGLLQNKD